MSIIVEEERLNGKPHFIYELDNKLKNDYRICTNRGTGQNK